MPPPVCTTCDDVKSVFKQTPILHNNLRWISEADSREAMQHQRCGITGGSSTEMVTRLVPFNFDPRLRAFRRQVGSIGIEALQHEAFSACREGLQQELLHLWHHHHSTAIFNCHLAMMQPAAAATIDTTTASRARTCQFQASTFRTETRCFTRESTSRSWLFVRLGV